MLEVKNLNYGYGKGCYVLKNINLFAGKGEIISLIGPNGCGKSTLLRCLCGLLKVPGDKIFLFDKPVGNNTVKEISQKIAFLPQFHEKIKGVTVRDLVSMGRAPYQKSGWIYTREDHEIINWSIDFMNVEHLKHRMVEELSGGEKQRVWIAMILAQDTPIILLDEPVTYMDLKYQLDLLRIIVDLKENFQKTVIPVFHDVNHALEVSDYIYLLSNNGRVYKAGTPEEVITEQSLQDVYGICAHIFKDKRCCRSIVVPAGFRRGKEEDKGKEEIKFEVLSI